MHITLDDIPKKSLQVARHIRGGKIFALIGPLGAGKTTFVKTVAKHLGITTRVTSPTFTLMNSYSVRPSIKNAITETKTLYHLDLYRTKKFAEVEQLGITEVWGKRNTIVFIEWADKIQKYLPKKTIFIYLNGNNEKTL